MKTKKQVKVNTKDIKEENEVTSFIKIILVIGILFLGAYLFTTFMNKKGFFNKKYVKPTVPEAVIDYDNILVGEVFNINNDSYYVVLGDFNGKDDAYLSSSLSSYKGKTPLYKVNMSSKFNSVAKGETSNKNASNSNELIIAKETLIKINNGKIVSYIEGTEHIINELDL
ncbi:MAG: hypothetical protein RR228_04015 [Bacilli bacterium]